MTRVTTETINGESIEITVDGAGVFQATFDEQQYTARELGALKEALAKAGKKAREQKAVDVSVVNASELSEKERRYGYSDGPYGNGRGVVHAKLRGHHARRSAWLLRSLDGKAFGYSGYNRDTDSMTLCRRLTDAEMQEYLELATAADKAKAALKAWLEIVRVDPEDLGFTK